MKSRLLQFIDRLRQAGLSITPSETLDASRALAVFGVEPLEFREAIAATVVKDEAARATFDDVFDRFFAVPPGGAGKRKPAQRSGSGDRTGFVPNEAPPTKTGNDTAPQRPTGRPSQRALEEQRLHSDRRRISYLRSLQDVPLTDMTPQQVDDCDALLRHLAAQLEGRAKRRRRAARHGRLDLRRTLRASISMGGVPMHPQFRRRRPGKPDLVALCDLSHSVAAVSKFLLSLLAGAPSIFRRVRIFGYVDSPVETWLQDRHVVHDGHLDLYSRSDFGKVLTHFWERHASLLTRNTLVLILGDARNNRRPPRAELLARLRGSSQRVVWLNPESAERWNTGDSVLAAYAPYCDELLCAGTLRQLHAVLKALTR